MPKLYVETLIKAELEAVWSHTQVPATHARWDGRFSSISYLPGTDPQRFRYSTCGVAGVGVTTGERIRPGGSRTSALRFSSGNPLSPIRSGAGYWRHVPVPDGVRFLTGYDYRPGWGRLPDLLVRPLVGWLTAWSFDRLRLWLEAGVPPERGRNRAIAELVVRTGLVAAAIPLGVVAAATAVLLAVLVPPLPGTPAGRRCLRRPPDIAAASAPATLNRLEQP